MRRKILIIIAMIGATFLTACAAKETQKDVLIYSSSEDYRNEYFTKRLKEEFPQYNITIEYIPSGNHAAKLKAEGTNTKCDITLDLDYAYLDMLSDNLADLSSYDIDIFEEDLVSSSRKYLPELRNGGSIVINTEVLEKRGLPEPVSYEDLLSPQYQGMITMPSPKTSGTGYMFLKSLVSNWGGRRGIYLF